MRKFAAVVAVVMALTVVPRIAGANPIQGASCADGAIFFECDIYADYDDGLSTLGPPTNLGGYLLGYTLLLKGGADLSDGLTASDISHILVIHENLFELYSNVATLLFNFDTIFMRASTGATIDGNAIDTGQHAGCATPSGVTEIDGVGYCPNEAVVSLLPDTIFGNDILRIHTAFPSDVDGTAPVPEPGTLSLLAFGGSAAVSAIRRRRAARASAN